VSPRASSALTWLVSRDSLVVGNQSSFSPPHITRDRPTAIWHLFTCSTVRYPLRNRNQSQLRHPGRSTAIALDLDQKLGLRQRRDRHQRDAGSSAIVVVAHTILPVSVYRQIGSVTETTGSINADRARRPPCASRCRCYWTMMVSPTRAAGRSLGVVEMVGMAPSRPAFSRYPKPAACAFLVGPRRSADFDQRVDLWNANTRIIAFRNTHVGLVETRSGSFLKPTAPRATLYSSQDPGEKNRSGRNCSSSPSMDASFGLYSSTLGSRGQEGRRVITFGPEPRAGTVAEASPYLASLRPVFYGVDVTRQSTPASRRIPHKSFGKGAADPPRSPVPALMMSMNGLRRGLRRHARRAPA